MGLTMILFLTAITYIFFIVKHDFIENTCIRRGRGLASPPVDVELIDIGTDWVTLRWHEPTWTGGRPILFYVVKYRHTSKFSDQFLKDPTPRSDNRWVIEKRTSSDVHKAKVIYLDPGVLYEFQVLACTLAGVGRGANLFVPLPPEDEVMTQAKAEIYTSTLKKHGHFKKHKTDKTFNLLKFPLSLWTDQG